jgi:outer membrane lipoprotein carrier protein
VNNPVFLIFLSVLMSELLIKGFSMVLPKHSHFLIFLSLFLFRPALAHADSFECQKSINQKVGEETLSLVQERYKGLQDFSSHFFQESYFLGLDKREYSKGTVRLKRPGYMDWNYTEPKEQRFISTGDTLYFFQPDLKQVTVGDFKQSFSSDIPVTFLLGIGEIKDSFTLAEACSTENGTALKLSPKKADDNLQAFILLVRPNDKTPLGARMTDIGGNETTILFQDILWNPGLTVKSFEFIVPQGIDVIDQRVKK